MATNSPRRMIVGITGASGTVYGIRVLEALRARGYPAVEETGRKIIQEQKAIGGSIHHDGDRIAYRSTVTAKRPSASRPDFGIVTAHQTGTNQERAVSGYSQTCQDEGRSAIDTKSYTAQSDVTTNLAGGTVDIMFADSPVASYAVTQTDGAVEVVGDQVDAAPEAVVVAKDDEAMAQAVQQALQYLMDHGYLAQILTSWGMGSDEALTTAEINPAV